MEISDLDINGIPATTPPKERTADAESTDVAAKSTDNIPSDLAAVGLLELFETDERQVLIYDLSSPTGTTPVYYNTRLREPHLAGLILAGKNLESIVDASNDAEHLEFAKWAIARPVGVKMPAATYCGIKWTSQTLRNRWRVIAGEVESQAVDISKQRPERPKLDVSQIMVSSPPRTVANAGMSPASVEAHLAAFTLHRGDPISLFPTGQETKLRTSPVNTPPSLGSYDILIGNPLVETSAHVEFFQNFDWASTELGPIDSWSSELRRMTNLLLTDPRPAAMYWGKNRIMMYNEPYVLVTGQKHPFMMGKPFSVAWAEIADDFAEAFEKGYGTGLATTMDDALFYLERHGFLEEIYYSLSMIPFGTSEGHMAFYNPVFETTRQVVAERRMAFLLQLGQFIASSGEPKDFWQQLLRGFTPPHHMPQYPDIPFALLYSAGGEINEELSVSSEQSQNLKMWALEGSVKINGMPSRLSSENDLNEFLPTFLDLIKKDSTTVLYAKDGSLPTSIVQAIQTTENSELCDTAVFIPIRPTGENALGFLILGINTRKFYDEDYQRFISIFSRQLNTSIAAAVLFEDETRRARMAAELATQDRNLLSKKLEIQTHEAFEIESRFRRMADMAPVGMFHFNTDGYLVYANEHYYDLMQHGRDLSQPMSWYNAAIPEQHALMDAAWDKLLRGEPISLEVRLNKTFEAEEFQEGQRVSGPTWIIAAAYPEKDHAGRVVGVLGCLTDISRQKWAEGFQKRKMFEAIELKRQQENFIDITSHEMRNPLSAIIQCADLISTSLTEFDAGLKDLTIPREIVDSHIDAAQTIILCAQHQRRIIDDILTLSKLDSDLLLITPIEVQPVSVIESALKMFGADLQKADIQLQLRVEQSYVDLTVDWVKLDPSRMLQVFINLLTNAIKFTQPEPKREIAISIGASLDRPAVRHGVEYLPRGTARKDLSAGAAWGSGEEVYLYIEVQDSGRGLSDHERKLLFQRFAQASPRTHVQYGGSGLGLFISRELTELQGGQIGVASTAGVGSIFAFYVKGRRCSRPESSTSVAAHQINMRTQTKVISSAALARIQDGPNPPKIERQASLPVLPPKHVLIVEDNIVNQRVLSKQLRNAGYIVSVANHGGEALTFLSTTRFWKGHETDGAELSLILMDLEMPTMDGLTCVKRIRQLQEEGTLVAHVPVIAVTANARSEQIATAKTSGMDSVVTKPFRVPELIPEMDKLMRKGIEKPDSVDRSASAPP